MLPACLVLLVLVLLLVLLLVLVLAAGPRLAPNRALPYHAP